ncbi:hypothetical protein [Tateyamaria sp.]|uniref:hypothetical protein n=1 Tax=Tateyamaria sp. TaxID=1929288 RepID=UPI003B2147D7
MTRFDVARTQQPKSTAAYGSLRFGPLRYQLKRTIGMLPTPDNSECSRQCRGRGKETCRRGMNWRRVRAWNIFLIWTATRWTNPAAPNGRPWSRRPRQGWDVTGCLTWWA